MKARPGHWVPDVPVHTQAHTREPPPAPGPPLTVSSPSLLPCEVPGDSRLSAALLEPPPPSLRGFSSVSTSPLLTRTPVIGLRAILTQEEHVCSLNSLCLHRPCFPESQSEVLGGRTFEEMLIYLLSYKEAELVRGCRKQGSLGFLLVGPWLTGVLMLPGWILVTHEASLFAYIQGPFRRSTCFHPTVYVHHLFLQTSFHWSHVGHAWNPPFRISCRDSLMLVTFSTFIVLKMCLFSPHSWKAFLLGIFCQVMKVAFQGLVVFIPALDKSTVSVTRQKAICLLLRLLFKYI